MPRANISRRSLLKTTGLAAAGVLSAPYVRHSHAAGKLAIGVWDHWVPGANNTLTRLCNEWGEKNKVEVTIDYITSQGDKDLLTASAEAQARAVMTSCRIARGRSKSTAPCSSRSTTWSMR